jgi:uroporphyrinogen decarboxylase
MGPSPLKRSFANFPAQRVTFSMSSTADHFGQLRVASLESRRADDMARLIQRHGGIAHVSPSMREVPIKPNRQAVDFAYRVITGQIGMVIFMTGVGFRFLLSAIQGDVDRQRFLDALSDIPTIVRGPKPAAAMKEVGLTPTYRVAEPNTWRELLQLVDASVPVGNLHIGLQEYGITNASLIAGLEARGATVDTIRVYGWEFPEDTLPLQENIQALAAGERDVVMFTSAHQVVNMLRMAETMGLADALRSGLAKTVIASIGPTTSQMLEECDFRVDLEPTHPKMGHLVVEAARIAPGLVKLKQATAATVAKTQIGNLMTSQFADSASTAIPKHPSHDSLFMKACRGESTERTPVWMMRQAGRYMAEYRSVRSQQSFLDLCKSPKLCSEVMCTAVDRLGVDAAIIFSDLLPILEPMGFDLEYVKGDGPVIHNPVSSAEDVGRVKLLEDPSSLGFVFETVSQTRADLPQWMPLIGFAGSPFTLASYAIEGGGSRQYAATKAMMYGHPTAWSDLMHKLSHAVIIYLNHQIAAGAQCVQLFDSWAGCLSPVDYVAYVQPYMRAIIAGITPGVPLINFATGNPELLPLLCGDSRTVVGVDWRIPLDVAWRRIDYKHPVQGNLDPGVLLGSPELIEQKTREVLDAAGGRPGHIFNVGHGILQQTPVENAIRLVELVKELSQR